MKEVLEKVDNKTAFPTELAVVMKDKHYTFENISGGVFWVDDLKFMPKDEDSIINNVTERHRRLIMKNKFVEKGLLRELDENGNVINSSDGDKVIEPLDDNKLLDIMKSKSKTKLDKFLETVDKPHIITRMKKICLENGLSSNIYVKLNDKTFDKE